MGLFRILVVDDSAFVRKVVREMLSQCPLVEVVGFARNGRDALEMVETLQPDLVTCDLSMPELDGLGFIRQQMKRKPVPIIVLSASPHDGAQVLEALEAGAIDFVQKPSTLANHDLFRIREDLVRKVTAAAETPSRPHLPLPVSPRPTLPEVPRSALNRDIVVLGISTGGPQALRYLLPQLPADFPVPLVIVLHMPVGYTALFAEKLAELSSIRVLEAYEGCVVEPSTVLLAPAGRHLSFRRESDGQVKVCLSVQPMDKPHRPSVDVLFRSAAETYRNRVLGVVMTGMGDDGKEGSAWIKAQGGIILTESEESCTIYGMPRAVVESGLSDGAVPLVRMAQEIIKRL